MITVVIIIIIIIIMIVMTKATSKAVVKCDGQTVSKSI